MTRDQFGNLADQDDDPGAGGMVHRALLTRMEATMADETTAGTARETPQRPVSDVFSQFGEELTDSVRREFEQLRDEAGQRARAGARGAALLAAATVSGAVASGAALTLPILALRRLIGPGATAVVIAAGAGGVTVVLGKRGLEELGVPTEAAAERVKDAARDVVAPGPAPTVP